MLNIRMSQTPIEGSPVPGGLTPRREERRAEAIHPLARSTTLYLQQIYKN